MFWKFLQASQFKCFNNLKIDLFPGINCIVGNNGMGKTNVLDALYYMSMTKSNFLRQDKDVIKHGEEWFRLEGKMESEGKSHRLEVKYKKGERKIFILNDKKYPKLSQHIGLIPIVLIAPDDIQDLLEGSHERRKFLDQSISQLNRTYLLKLSLCNKILQQRNAVLKQNLGPLSRISALLDTYDEQMKEPSSYIFQERLKFIAEFQPYFNAYYQLISGGQESVKLDYQSQLKEEDWMNSCHHAREKDNIMGRTHIGIHKDDIGMLMNGNKLKTFASQGQKKSFVLSMRLAQFEYLQSKAKTKPILLLDDVFDKLDNKRVESLLRIISKNPFGQVFITDTHSTRVPSLLVKWKIKFKLFHLENGRILDELNHVGYEEE